ncbi:WD40-repeat-containing domain protein [Pseudoneurospora amorphoporcata]|uniref:WD40-repeat-containing domain protein n=1 Tax=Pseudoneurospora amorphoporcata TaxID=241081 RepID=A0AAN6NV52_9PEZI|nr:WD40-repeat-containing domain protein [Pseudoneurospora amorphoporcata]
MQSSDPRHFFETDAEIAKRERREAKTSNTYGNPIKLKSKILGAVVDPRAPSSAIFVAESAGAVRRVQVDGEGDTSTVYRGPTTPVSCVAVGGPGNKIIFAGAWDKNIWSWDIDTRAPARKYAGHSDFVKAIVCAKLSGKDVLVSGGADKKLIVWDVATGSKLHVLQDSVVNMLSIQDLVVDPASSSPDELCIVSASSDPHIRRWKIRLDGWEQFAEPDPATPAAERHTILVHETTVYKLVIDHEGNEVDLWTASGDGTAKCLSRIRGFTSDDIFEHGDHVRAVAVTDQWVITAGRDEDLKIWDRTSGKLYCSLEGHYDEVTELVILRGSAGSSERVCSVSIDGTVRTWALDKASLDAAVEEQKKPIKPAEEEKPDGEGLLTADEEAELAALMEDDD